jgi:cellulose biosynthesis protein BcsQ
VTHHEDEHHTVVPYDLNAQGIYQPRHALHITRGTTRRPRVIAVANNKGGVGKTMVVGELADALGRNHIRVLLIDLDPQANLTRRLDAHDAERLTIGDLLSYSNVAPYTDAVVVCGRPVDHAAYIHVLQSSLSLEDRAKEASEGGAERRLAMLIDTIPDNTYDVILIDLPPALGHLFQMAQVALGSDPNNHLISVTNPEYDALDGTIRAHNYAKTYGRYLGVKNDFISTVIVNDVDLNTKLHSNYVDTILPNAFNRDTYPLTHLAYPIIPNKTILATNQNDAVSMMQILESDANSRNKAAAHLIMAVFDHLIGQNESAEAHLRNSDLRASFQRLLRAEAVTA